MVNYTWHHNTLKTLADGVAGDVHEVALLENIRNDKPLAWLEFIERLEEELL